MNSYLVTVIFDVDADHPQEAAEHIDQIVGDDIMPPTVTVQDEDGHETTVDLIPPDSPLGRMLAR